MLDQLIDQQLLIIDQIEVVQLVFYASAAILQTSKVHWLKYKHLATHHNINTCSFHCRRFDHSPFRHIHYLDERGNQLHNSGIVPLEYLIKLWIGLLNRRVLEVSEVQKLCPDFLELLGCSVSRGRPEERFESMRLAVARCVGGGEEGRLKEC